MITLPLTNLTKKNTKFTWTPLEQGAVIHMLHLIADAPCLKYFDPHLETHVYTDASEYGIGGWIGQKHTDGIHPVIFWSRKLIPAETNYPTHERELLALVKITEKYRHMLLGKPFTAYTDHRALKFIHSQQFLSARQARWLQNLQEFEILIEYIPGELNFLADALSRSPDYAPICSSCKSNHVDVATCEGGGEVLSDYALRTNQDLLPRLKKYFKDNSMQRDELNKKGLVEKEGLYYYNGRLYIPDEKNWRSLILQQAHDIPTAGHQGQNRTINKLLPNIYWESLREDCMRFINSCDACQRTKYSNKKPEGYLIPLDIPEKRFDTIGIDFTPLPTSKDGKNNLMIIYCKLTKITALIPTTIDINTKEAAKLFFTHWYCRGYGLPKVIISDRDKLFVSSMWQDLMDLLEIKLVMSTARHQQTNGGSEHLVKMAKLCLSSTCAKDPSDWPNSLAATEFALNSSLSSATGYAPLALAFGLSPLEISENCKEIQITEQIKNAKINMAKAQDKMEKYANKLKSSPEEIKLGDLVLLDRDGLNWASDKNTDKKLM
jgi:hypothetical protein